MMQNQLNLRLIKNSDIDLLEKWLNKDYILKWYHDAGEWIREVAERNNAFSFLKHYIVLEKDKPLGFCQYYDCFDAQEEWYLIDTPNKIYSIDYLIGEENYLQKGYGKKIVEILVAKIVAEENPEAIIVQPDKENIPSCRVLLANGFIYDEEREYYVLKF